MGCLNSPVCEKIFMKGIDLTVWRIEVPETDSIVEGGGEELFICGGEFETYYLLFMALEITDIVVIMKGKIS